MFKSGWFKSCYSVTLLHCYLLLLLCWRLIVNFLNCPVFSDLSHEVSSDNHVTNHSSTSHYVTRPHSPDSYSSTTSSLSSLSVMTPAPSRRRAPARWGGTASTTRSTSCETCSPSQPPPDRDSPSSSWWLWSWSMLGKQIILRNVSATLRIIIDANYSAKLQPKKV